VERATIEARTRVKRRISGAIIGVIVLAILGVVLWTDRCYVEEHSVFIAIIGIALFLALVFTNKVVRIILIVLALGVCLTYQRSEFTPSAESGAVLTLRQTAVLVQKYRQSHPSEGFPSRIAPVTVKCRAQNVYEFNYQSEKSQLELSTDRFTLVAVPFAAPSSRGLRSFAIAEDGRIHVSRPNEGRPANRSDPVLE